MNWSVEQRRLLRALGHEVMVQGRVWPSAPAAASMPAASAPVRRAMPLDEPVARPSAAPAQAARLLEALRRAAGGADVAALAGDLELLRRQPALKRALWPQLRALRRSH